MTNQKTEDERRHYKRIPFIADVLLSLAGQQWNCVLLDISLKGLLIEAPEGIEVEQGTAYSVELLLGEGASINMTALVSHTKGTHWGLQWENIELDGLTHLRRLLELNMGNTEEMHRELAELG